MNADLENQESNKTELERRGSIFNIGAPATEAVTIRDQIAVGFGDGTVRFFQSGSDPKTVKAHKGVVLSMTNYEDHVLTGGDDGRFLKYHLMEILKKFLILFKVGWLCSFPQRY